MPTKLQTNRTAKNSRVTSLTQLESGPSSCPGAAACLAVLRGARQLGLGGRKVVGAQEREAARVAAVRA